MAATNKCLAQMNKPQVVVRPNLSGIGLKVMWEKQRKQHTSLTTAE
jgi:hypothetical protein